MILRNCLSCLVLSTLCLGLAGCGPHNPNANVPKEKIAPAPQDLGNDPEYVKQFGGKK
jgi:predicted small lipoprotein YifL